MRGEHSVVSRLMCPRRHELVVIADDFRPKTTDVPFEAGSVDVTLDARDFRP